jgi:signal transduction histidine kinase
VAVRFRTFQLYATVSIVLVFAGVTAIAAFLGVQTSLRHWQTDHGIEFDEFLSERLSRLMSQTEPVDAALIADYLTPYLDPTLYAMVFDADDVLIYWTWKGDHWYWRRSAGASLDTAGTEAQLARLMGEESPVPLVNASGTAVSLARQFRTAGVLQEVVAAGRPIGGFVAGSNGFTVNRTNRRLLEELARGAVLGLVSATVLSAAIAGSFSRRMGRAIRSITRSIGRIAAGNRTETLPICRIAELNEISGSAAELQRRLSREEQLRRQWTMDIAHDLRTPIANLRAQAEAMSDGLLESSPERLHNLAVNAHRLSQLADKLLLLARVESPEYELNLASLPVRDLALSLHQAFDERVAEEGRTLTVEATTGSISADCQLVERALGNLVENALRHGHGAIHCALSETTLAVRNRGTIGEDVRQLVFNRLYRGAPDRSGDGHGLGLAIVKAVSDLHGWTVHVDSANDEVIFTLTVNSGQPPAARPTK